MPKQNHDRRPDPEAYVVKNVVTGSFWGFKREVAEFPDAAQHDTYIGANALAETLGHDWRAEQI